MSSNIITIWILHHDLYSCLNTHILLRKPIVSLHVHSISSLEIIHTHIKIQSFQADGEKQDINQFRKALDTLWFVRLWKNNFSLFYILLLLSSTLFTYFLFSQFLSPFYYRFMKQLPSHFLLHIISCFANIRRLRCLPLPLR